MQRKICLTLVICLVLNIIIPVIYAAEELPTFAVVEETVSEINAQESVETVKEVETKTAVSDANFNFTSKSQILMDMDTGIVIYENKADEKAYPASVTKIMTLLLIMEAIDSGKIAYTDMVTCSENAASMGGSQIWFKVGEQITVDEALKCICVVSANDVCIAMAELIGGNEENFVKMMNDKAKELGMNGTNFVNVHGIDDENHYTTARDIAKMSIELMIKHKDITKYTTIWMDSIRGGTFALSNTNKLIRYYDGATGLKTGYTSIAKYNLSATATKNGMSLVAVVLTAPSSDIRNEEAKQLLNYGFANYETQKICEKGEVIDKININKYLGDKVDVVLENDISILNEKGKKVECKKQIKINNKLCAPLKKGDKVGEVIYTNQDGIEIGKVNVVINEDIKKSGLLDYIKQGLNIYTMGKNVF